MHFSIFLSHLLVLQLTPIILTIKVMLTIDIRIDLSKTKAILSAFKLAKRNYLICSYPKSHMLKIDIPKIRKELRIKIKAKANSKPTL